VQGVLGWSWMVFEIAKHFSLFVYFLLFWFLFVVSIAIVVVFSPFLWLWLLFFYILKA